MKENPKGRLTIIGIASLTIVLAGIAIFTATKIFQSKKESVTPTTPEVEPLAQTPTSTPTPIPSATPTGLLAQAGSPTPTIHFLTSSPTTTPTPTRTASVSATLTPTRRVTTSPTLATETLPDSGVSYPTILVISFGTFLLVVSFLLAL